MVSIYNTPRSQLSPEDLEKVRAHYREYNRKRRKPKPKKPLSIFSVPRSELSPEDLEKVRAYHRAHKKKPKIRKQMKEYDARPEVKQRKKERNQKREQRPDVKQARTTYRNQPHVHERRKEWTKNYRKNPDVKKRDKENKERIRKTPEGAEMNRRYANARGTGHTKHRRQILEEQDFQCQLCPADFRDKETKVTIHHIHPVAEKATYPGKNIHERENLIALCELCHVAMHADGYHIA